MSALWATEGIIKPTPSVQKLEMVSSKSVPKKAETDWEEEI
ncbi:hypothetical protein [Streptococcus suis]|nr:hypothetical protein [Streptococcus suis]